MTGGVSALSDVGTVPPVGATPDLQTLSKRGTGSWDENVSVTPEQLATVGATAAVVAHDRDGFGRHFYERLFAQAPEAPPLFPDVRDEQHRELVGELLFVCGAVADLDRCLADARALGARLVGYGLRPELYPVLGRALVDTLADVVGPAFDAEAAEAWRRLYLLVSEAMLEGAAGDLFAP